MHSAEPPRIALAQLPTPVVELKNLARDLQISRLLVKRDDLTGLELSGNKIRKLEYVVADALAQGATSLVTHGGFQSNHCRATAAVGARMGLHVRLILRCTEAAPALNGNLFLDHLLGAEITYHSPAEYNQQRQALIQSAMDAQRAAGRTPYFFPVGASIPLGCWGYIRCVEELIAQLGRDEKIDLFCAISSAGTQAGLMLGKALLGCRDWRVVGVPVSDSVAELSGQVRELERRTVEAYGLGLSEKDTPIEMIDGFIGEGYAIPYAQAIETVRLLARTEGLLLDPTYTAKAMTGVLATIRNGGVRRGATPVFIHTGGAFGLMARRDLFSVS